MLGAVDEVFSSFDSHLIYTSAPYENQGRLVRQQAHEAQSAYLIVIVSTDGTTTKTHASEQTARRGSCLTASAVNKTFSCQRVNRQQHPHQLTPP